MSSKDSQKNNIIFLWTAPCQVDSRKKQKDLFEFHSAKFQVQISQSVKTL